MGMSSFSGPLRSGTTDANSGLAVLSKSSIITFADLAGPPATLQLFTLPAGSRILQFTLTVTVAFNAGTNNTVDILSAPAGVRLARVTATGAPIAIGHYFMATAAAAGAPLHNSVGSTDFAVFGGFAGTGSAADAGTATVSVMYVQRRANGSAEPAV